MKRIIQSIRLQLILILILFAVFNTYFITSVVLKNVENNIYSTEFERLNIISNQLRERYEKMYFAEYISRNLASMTEAQRKVYLRVFLKPAFEEYFDSFTNNFPTIEFGYSLPAINDSISYKQIENMVFKNKITVITPVSEENGGGYVFVDEPLEYAIKPLNELSQEINRINLYVLLSAILVSLIFTSLFTARIVSLRRGLKKLEKDLDFRFPNYSGEIGDIAVSVNIMAENLKRTVEEMQRTESLKNLGLFTVGVVHEVRNPLTSIKGFAQILEKKLQGTEEERFVQPIIRETERLSKVVDDLLKYGKPSEIQRTHFNVRQFFEHLLEIVSGYTSENRISFKLECEEFDMFADEQKSEELFLNLLINAVQSIEREGEVRIDCKKEGETAIIKIADTGAGMTDEDLDNIFVPFYTTKASGTGLGLAIVYRIVTEHGGTITVESERGTGTTFTVSLPIGDKK